MSTIEYVSIGDLPEQHPAALFYRLWHVWADGENSVCIDRFKPFEIPHIMPWMMIFEKVSYKKYRYKFVGSSVELISGQHYQGRIFGDALPEEFVERVVDEFNDIENGAAPTLGTAMLPEKEKAFRQVYRGVFGFADAEGVIDQIVVVIAPPQDYS